MLLTRLAVTRGAATTLLFALLAIFGMLAYFSLGQNVLPNTVPPVVTVFAEYPGASPEFVERQIIRPIENRLRTLRGIEHVNATARPGSAILSVEFTQGTDVSTAGSDVQQEVDAARVDLPDDMRPVRIEKGVVSDAPVLREFVSSNTVKLPALATYVDRTLVPALRTALGVGSVAVSGSQQREFHVEVDPAALRALGLGVLDVRDAVAQSNALMPGGRLTRGPRELELVVDADLRDARDLAATPVVPQILPAGMTPGSLHLGEIARIDDGRTDEREIVTLDGKRGIAVDVTKSTTGNTRAITDGVRRTLATLRAERPDINVTEMYADALFMDASLAGVRANLLEGVVLTALVMLVFLHALRHALVVMVAIPVSILGTFVVMALAGVTIDAVSLMGLSLTIGILVDDSIVVLENITRRFNDGASPVDAAIDGRSEIGFAAIAITAVDVVVYVPLAFVGGSIGADLREFALVVVCATLFSLLVSFTLTPFVAARFALVPLRANAFSRRFDAGFERLRETYLRWLRAALARRYTVLAAAAGLVLLSLVPVITGFVPFEFQPYTAYGEIRASIAYPPGRAIDATAADAARFATAIASISSVAHVETTIGTRSDATNQTQSGSVASFDVFLKPDRRGDELATAARIHDFTALVPGATITAQGLGNSGAAPIGYRIAGPTALAAATAGRLADRLDASGLVEDVALTGAALTDLTRIRVDRNRATLMGVDPHTVAETARAFAAGIIATRVHDDGELVDVVVRYPKHLRTEGATLEDTLVRSLDGRLVPLASVVRFERERQPEKIDRVDGRRIVALTAYPRNGAPIGPAVAVIDAARNEPGFVPAGITVLPLADSDTANLGATLGNIGISALVSLGLIYAVLVILFGNFRQPLVVMASVPVAATGIFGILMLFNALHALLPGVQFFAGQTLNLFSFLGIVMTFGLVAKNGILLVDYAQTLRRREGLAALDAVVASARLRLRPIVMTTASMIAGMLPLALGLTEGAEFRKSIGSVIIGGVGSSLLLTLFVVPVVYALLAECDRFEPSGTRSTGERPAEIRIAPLSATS